MLEFEKKVLLSEPEYRFLKENRYRAGKTAVQVNHYYDTDDFALSRQGITCRIREKNGVCTDLGGLQRGELPEREGPV